MAYCTLQNLIDEFGDKELLQLTDRDNVGLMNQDVLDRAIQRADNVINRYLGGRKAVPVPTGALVDLACDITRYYLFAVVPPDEVRTRFEDAVKQLEKLAKGQLAVVDDAGHHAAESGDAVRMTSARRVLGWDDDGFI